MAKSINFKRRSLLIGAALLPVSGLVRAALPTPPAAEGPFYPTTDMRFTDVDNDLVKIEGAVREAGGEVVQLVGTLTDRDGNAIANAVVEIWQCDATGRYLHSADRRSAPRDGGFQGFGRSLTDAQGRFSFRTIKPVPYPGRTPHIHVKVWQDGVQRLTTQLYIRDHPDNARDFLFQRLSDTEQQQVAMAFDQGALPTARISLVV